MLRPVFSLIVIILLQACGQEAAPGIIAQAESSAGKVIGDTSNVSCKLTSEELQERKATVLATLKSKVTDKRELSNGYSFRFDNTDEMIDLLTEFVKSERQCCDFFNFAIHINNDGTIWFDLTGPEGAKEMIGQELAM